MTLDEDADGGADDDGCVDDGCVDDGESCVADGETCVADGDVEHETRGSDAARASRTARERFMTAKSNALPPGYLR
ncbi:hypothetical protein [Lapillicoccus sp.]|uniref:hypothetical protein n=1 Tax=Lapillicoccus sp. TaxID=1909287 RepID=UPI003263A4A4